MDLLPGSLGRVGRLMVGPSVLLPESGQTGIHGTKPHQQCMSAWKVTIHLGNSSLPCSGEIAKCSMLFRIINQVPSKVGRVLISQF
jgi:hypothetical protein